MVSLPSSLCLPHKRTSADARGLPAQGMKEDQAGEILVTIVKMEPRRPMHFQLKTACLPWPAQCPAPSQSVPRDFQLWQMPVRFHAPFPYVIKMLFLPQAKENTGIFNFKMFG